MTYDELMDGRHEQFEREDAAERARIRRATEQNFAEREALAARAAADREVQQTGRMRHATRCRLVGALLRAVQPSDARFDGARN
jgi:hypothetical protein